MPYGRKFIVLILMDLISFDIEYEMKEASQWLRGITWKTNLIQMILIALR